MIGRLFYRRCSCQATHFIKRYPILDAVTETLKQKAGVRHQVAHNVVRAVESSIALLKLVWYVPVEESDKRRNTRAEESIDQVRVERDTRFIDRVIGTACSLVGCRALGHREGGRATNPKALLAATRC